MSHQYIPYLYPSRDIWALVLVVAANALKTCFRSYRPPALCHLSVTGLLSSECLRNFAVLRAFYCNRHAHWLRSRVVLLLERCRCKLDGASRARQTLTALRGAAPGAICARDFLLTLSMGRYLFQRNLNYGPCLEGGYVMVV